MSLIPAGADSPERAVPAGGLGRVAVAHEWLAARAGSEKTFEAIARALPDADLYALTADPAIPWEVDRPIATTFLDHRPLRDRRELTLPLMPLAWRWATKERYDLVVTSSHACVKGFRPARMANHLCYTHTPMRYAWLGDVDARRLPRILTGPLRSWDRRAADWVDAFAANSTAVADRIRDFYGREAVVIPPPVDTTWFCPEAGGSRGDDRGGFVLAVGRFISYKRFDVLVDLARASDLSVVIAGRGPLEPMLRAAAAELTNLTVVTGPDDTVLRDLYRRAGVLVFPGNEDFGLVPLEAQACGTPVVALGIGGALDTVSDGLTGILVDDVGPSTLVTAIDRLDRMDQAGLAAACRAQAATFDISSFTRRFTDWVHGVAGASG
jgi:glycosyltransferase involved in cell wall biosynthesis